LITVSMRRTQPNLSYLLTRAPGQRRFVTLRSWPGYAFKLFQQPRVAVAFFGDGASNNGAFHEGLNMAGIWKLPVLFVCENNQFATEVPVSYSAANPDIGARAKAYNSPGVTVGGNDVRTVFATAADAVKRARAGEGAPLIECRTYRTRAHAEGMGDFTYRTREEVESWKARCPIQTYWQRLLAEGLATETELTAIEQRWQQTVVEAFQQASSDPLPAAATATRQMVSRSSGEIVRRSCAAGRSPSPISARGADNCGAIGSAT